jgi:hypothetical protein
MPIKIGLPDNGIVRIYGKRRDIEVYFKMMKHLPDLEKEARLRDWFPSGNVSIFILRMSVGRSA